MRRRADVLRLTAVTIASVLLLMTAGGSHRPRPMERISVVAPATTMAPVTTTTVDWPAIARLADAEYRAWRAADYHTWSDWPTWHALGICEQGGSSPEGDGIAWHGSAAGGSASSAYPGGLGISAEAWDSYRGAAGVSVSVGAYASPADQIRVGREEVREVGGFRGWAPGTLRCMGERFGIYVN